MFIGRIGPSNNFNKVSAVQKQTALMQRINSSQNQTNKRSTGAVDIFSLLEHNQFKEGETGIYRPGNNMLKSFAEISYTRQEPDTMLQAELLPPSEKTGYTEHDALMNEYMKQTRIEGRFEGDTFVRSSDDPVKLILPDMVSDAELEALRKELNQRQGNQEIDWQGVKNDFVNMGVGFDNAERLEMKADYLASRYAVLKDRIQKQYSGDEQAAQMDMLENIYSNAKGKMADKYAAQIGGFYEDLGQQGAYEDFKTSVLTLVDEKAAAYEEYLSTAGDYAKISDPQDKWLLQDDAYMASQLREKYNEVGKSEKENKTQAVYSKDDLLFAGVYAKALSSQLKNAEYSWDTSQQDSALGEFLAKQSSTIIKKMTDAGVGQKMSNILKDTLQPYMDKFMDELDKSLDKNQEKINKNPWMSGLIRTQHIDRDSVYKAFQNAITNM